MVVVSMLKKWGAAAPPWIQPCLVVSLGIGPASYLLLKVYGFLGILASLVVGILIGYICIFFMSTFAGWDIFPSLSYNIVW